MSKEYNDKAMGKLMDDMKEDMDKMFFKYLNRLKGQFKEDEKFLVVIASIRMLETVSERIAYEAKLGMQLSAGYDVFAEYLRLSDKAKNTDGMTAQ